MIFNKIVFVLISVSLVLAYPLIERRAEQENALVLARAPTKTVPKAPAKAKAPTKAGSAPPLQYTGGGVVENARKANSDPARKLCKKVADCSCPNNPNSKTGHSTSCINGVCSCDNAVVNLFANKFIEAVAAIGNAGITKAIGGLMQGIATVKQVAGIIAGAVLGPQAKAALKVALNAIPETGPSYLDKATKGALTKIL